MYVFFFKPISTIFFFFAFVAELGRHPITLIYTSAKMSPYFTRHYLLNVSISIPKIILIYFGFPLSALKVIDCIVFCFFILFCLKEYIWLKIKNAILIIENYPRCNYVHQLRGVRRMSTFVNLFVSLVLTRDPLITEYILRPSFA